MMISKTSPEPGKTIDQAYGIIQRTYQEINAMKDDFASILKEIDPRIEFSKEYSYRSVPLYLRSFHIFLFKRFVEEEKPSEEFIIGVVILFSKEGRYKKLSSVDGPEIWICKMQTKNITEATKPEEIADCLTPDERKYFAKKTVKIGGKVLTYQWKDEENGEEGEQWTGRFIGFPLTAIRDRKFIMERIIKKLDI